MLGALTGSALLAVLGSFAFPGVGQGFAAHRLRGVVWAIACIASVVLVLVSVWALVASLALRVASAVDAYLCMRRHTPPHDFKSAAIALVIGAVGIGGVKMTMIEGFKIPSSSMYPTLIIGDHLFVDKLSVKWREPSRGEIIVFEQPCAHRTYIKRVIAIGGDTVEVRCSVVYVNGIAKTPTLVAKETEYSDYDDSRGEWFKRSVSRYRETIDGHTFDTFRGDQDRGDFPSRDRPFAPSCTHGEFFGEQAPAANQPSGTLVESKSNAEACEPQLHFVVPPRSLFVMGDHRHNANDSRYWGVVPLGNVIGRAINIWMSDGPEGSWSRFGAIE